MAQTFKPRQIKGFKPSSDTLVLDSLSLVPGSIHFKTFPSLDSAQKPEVNYNKHALIFKGKRPDSIVVDYKRFPYNFENTYAHKDASFLYSDMSRPSNPFMIRFDHNNNQLLQNDGLNKNGNISRGITFGNSQDVVVNSNLNLQISGKLTPEIDLVMAATDNNIPFQADGTTAQLQEFDKVYIQLSNQTTKMIVGDYQLARPQNSYFMSFYKRAQGLYLENIYTDTASKKPLTFKTQLSGAVSRGKFARQVFFGIENNQGPYRLKGADNEPFIIILSGTERIYIDGKLLQRGQENDYIIDYNTGELTFTAKQQITKDKRIVAEFQYAERNYARSMFFFGEEVSTRKTKMYLNVFNEQDNKNRPLQQSLEQPQRNVMIEAGDSLDKAVFTGAERDSFSTAGIFYRKLDTIVGSFVYPEVYVYTTNPDSGKYTLRFSVVGANKGNYNIVNTTANGRVYQWTAPIDGIPQGSYEPVIQLVTPKQSQMVTAGFTHSISPDNSIGLEGVYTKYDINKFSSKDKGNDEGSGVKVLSRNQTVFRVDSLKRETKLVYNLNYEFVQKRFVQIERFRSIEFERDWNRPLATGILNDQHLAGIEIGLLKTKKAGINYSFNMFNEGNDYLGIRHNVNTDYVDKNSQFAYSGSYLTSRDLLSDQNTEFYRHKSLLSRKVDVLKFAYTDVFENNKFRDRTLNTLAPRSYQFWEWEGSVSNADSSKTSVKLFYRERRDKLSYSDKLRDSTFATNIGLQASVYAIKNNPFTIVTTYRKLNKSENIVGSSITPDNTLLNRVEYNPKYFRGLITAGMFYETGYGLENKREYYYLEVAPGQGQYAWIDYNGNGIQEKNEFEVALYQDQQRFIRIYTPTNDYVKVLQNQLSISMNVRPSAILRNAEKSFPKFINRWMLQTALQFDNKISDSTRRYNFNPFEVVRDSFLLASNNNVRQSVFFNQSSAVFGADYTYVNNKARQLLTNGIEGKTLESHEVKWRFNFFKAWAINSDNTFSMKGNRSEFFPIRNYYIKTWETEQKLVFQPNTVFRISAIYKYTDKKNTLKESGLQYANLINYAVELKYNQTEKGSLTGRLDFIKITYTDVENSSIAYEMLNGLNIGDNFTWELNYQRNLSSNIQISINYNGRKTPNAPVVHIGGAQVRAFF
ncbi:MAG: hypothetical protein JNL60_14050 [Bacteroidia bacterium]|nr:hypothetical protein [Bacteroidia bacterium]